MIDPRPARPTIYFALGRADRLVCEHLIGQPVLESFAYQCSHFARYRPTWRSAFLDSGAFTELTQGVAIDLGAYIDFCLEHGAMYERIANLDDIRGDVARSQANHHRMLDAGIRALPVFHQGEAWSVLDEVVSSAPDRFIGVGFQRPIRDALMAVDGQGAEALRSLTPGELLEIVVKRYERMARYARGKTATPAGFEPARRAVRRVEPSGADGDFPSVSELRRGVSR